MHDFVHFSKQNGVAVITIDNNPPVNAIGSEILDRIAAAIDELNSDVELSAAVIIGAGNSFVAGADINHRILNETVRQIVLF